MTKFFYIVFVSLFTLSSFSQEVKYFSSGFKTHINQKSDYIRLYNYNNEIIEVRDFVRDTLYRKGRFFGFTDTKVLDEFIYENSKSSKVREPREEFLGKKAYVQFYKRNGSLTSQLLYNENESKFIQIYRDGVGLLENGNGEYISESNNKLYYRKYSDSVKVEGYFIRLEKNDTIYDFDIVEGGMPKKGMQKFYSEIFKKLNKQTFLKDIDKNRIIITFIADKEGNLTEFSTKDIESKEVKEQMFNKLDKLNNWYPAKFNGKRVKTILRIPLNIKQQDDNYLIKLR
jgi:hypothetical protein